MRHARAVLPNEALNMEEIKFWLKIMQEHTTFIKVGLPSEANDYIDAVKEFHKAFSSLLQKTERFKNNKKLNTLLTEISSVLVEFCNFQRKLLSDKMNAKLGGAHYPFFFDHIIRETEYFLVVIQQIETSDVVYKNVSQTKEIVVWLRLMSDHVKLICHYLDPSERRLLKMSMEYAELFDNLVLEARDVASMLYCYKGEIAAFRRFLLDVRLDVQRVRDFKQMAAELISDCRLLSIMSVDLVDHMKRESEHFLMVLTMIEKGMVKHCPEVFQDDAEGMNLNTQERLDEEVIINDSEDDAEETDDHAEELSFAGEERIKKDMTEHYADTPKAVELGEMGLMPKEENITDHWEEEPLVAIMPMESEENTRICESIEASAEENVKDVLKEEKEIAPEPEKPAEKKASPKEPEPIKEPIVPVQDIDSQAVESVGETPSVIREKVYAKASDYKYMPSKYAGKTPTERIKEKYQKTQNKIRPLGKK